MNRKLFTIVMLAVMLGFSACDNNSSEPGNVSKTPVKITEQRQAESIARSLWQLITNLDDKVADGNLYEDKKFSTSAYGDFVLSGSKTTDSYNCTHSYYYRVELNGCKYSDCTFEGALQYEEMNYHYNKNYKRTCKLWAGQDLEQNFDGLKVRCSDYNIEDICYMTITKVNTDKKYNCDRTPASVVFITSSGERYDFTIK